MGFHVEIDGIPCTERDYVDLPIACRAIASILRQHGERGTGLDEEECGVCEEPLDLVSCSQCGADAFVRPCDHGGPRPIRIVNGAMFCGACRS